LRRYSGLPGERLGDRLVAVQMCTREFLGRIEPGRR